MFIDLTDLARLHWRVLRIQGFPMTHRFAWFVFAFFITIVPVRAAALPEPAELPGPLVIAGGGKLPEAARAEFFKLAGQEKARIIVVPTASADADEVKQQDAFLKSWQELKPESVVILHTRDSKTANDPTFIKPLEDATAIWFSGGDQTKLLAAYRGTLTEKAFHKLHQRGGVIGGTSAGAAVMSDLMIESGTDVAKTGPGFGFLPGFVVDQHFVARNRRPRLEGVLAANPGYVGLGIDEGTAVVINKRTLRVYGDSSAAALLGAGAGKKPLAEVNKTGGLFDLYQLRRAAANRASADAFPPAKPRDPEVPKGALVIVGGGGTTPAIMNTFFEKAGGKDALIVAIPVDEASGPGDAGYLRRYGATNVKVLFTKDRKLADDPAFSEVLTKAGGVWFGGGRQWRFVDSFEGTLVQKRCQEVLARGGVIGGSSAGASIQSEFMPRGHPLGNTVMAAEGYERGFGFLPGCAVDQHFFARKRTGDMTGLMAKYPQYLGIGIDEATAIVVTGHTAEVLGKSKVGFYDTRAKLDGDKDYVELVEGEKYDLKMRQKLK